MRSIPSSFARSPAVLSELSRRRRDFRRHKYDRRQAITTDNNTDDNSSLHIDEWFESIRKPQEFYDKHAESRPSRAYFYNIDLQGRLFLESTVPKNLTSAIKDPKFLDFFFARIRALNEKEEKFLEDIGVLSDYPFISPCGRELNFIRPAATPIVFHTFDEKSSSLRFGGALSQRFDSTCLAVSKSTGLLYHKLLLGDATTYSEPRHRKYSASKKTSFNYGLIQSAVAGHLSQHIEINGEGVLTFQGMGECNPSQVAWLPEEDEPGISSFQAYHIA